MNTGNNNLGVKNDKYVREIILDFLNENVFKNKKYSLRTITTIFANFYDEGTPNRYHIDSPQWKYLPDLNKYIAEIKADNFFFDQNNKPREGFFLFEYILKNDELIILKNVKCDSFTEQYYLQNIKSFIPVVHSTVYDHKLDWKNVTVTHSPKHKPVSTEKVNRILYIFDKENILDYPYSVFVTFCLNQEVGNIKSLVQSIKSDYFKMILTLAKGISLESSIDELLARTKVLELFEKNILAHKHSFFQLDIETPLLSALNALTNEDYKRLEQKLKVVSQEFQIMHILNCLIFNKVGEKNKLQGKSILEIIRFLHINYGSQNSKPKIDDAQIGRSDFIPSNSKLIQYFTIIFNLWANASKDYGKSTNGFKIIAKADSDNKLILIFENNKAMPQVFKDYLNSKNGLYPRKENSNSEDRFKGLAIVKDMVGQLDVRIKATVDEKNDTTQIELFLKNEK